MNNVEVMQAFYNAVIQGDKVAAAGFLHPDFHVVESEGLPYSGRFEGVDGFFQLFETVFGCWSNPRIEPLQIIGDPNGDTFAYEMSMAGTSRGTGKAFATTVCEIWTMKDGKIAKIKPYYWDTKLMAEIA